MKPLVLCVLMFGAFAGCSKENKATDETVSCTSDNPDRWSTGVSSIVQSNCVSCHSAYSSRSGAAADAASIASQVNIGAMPKGFALSAADRASLVQWAACGAPQ